MRDYVAKVRLFSRNARLYVLHVIGMDMIHGTWSVLFNLYLLAIGLPIEFIGLRILVYGVAGAVSSVPAGVVADRIGRKTSFVLGDGLGATLGLVNILTTSRSVLLMTAVLGAFFSALHEVSEPPFMHENSREDERVHLFSVAGSLRTASATVGSVLAAAVPLWLSVHVGRVSAYRWATLGGLALWFASLIPALLLREERPPAQRPTGFRAFLGGIEHPGIVARLVVPSAVFALGAGLVLPLGNVFFHEALHVHEGHIGTTFASAQALVAVGMLFAPLLAARMTKVGAVVATRALSIPFVLLVAVATSSGAASWTVAVVTVAWIGRAMTYQVSSPIASAFSMQILGRRERATMAGIEAGATSALTAAGGFLGSRLMAAGSYSVAFLAMAALCAVSVGLYWMFFRGSEHARPLELEPAVAVA